MAPATPFRGFDSPNYTPIPDQFFDELMTELSEAELRVLLYVMRRIFGFRKDADSISLNQLVEGITTADGRRLDHGCGLGRTAVKKGVKLLVERGVLTVTKVRSESGEYETNTYQLVIREGVGRQTTYPGSQDDLPVGRDAPLQETEQQETGGQEPFEISKGPTPDFGFGPERDAILDYLADFARELGDTAPLSSSVTRAAKLYRRSGLSLDDFISALYAARAKTKERTAAIRAQPVADGRAIPIKPKMAYFFGVLENVVRQRQAESAD